MRKYVKFVYSVPYRTIVCVVLTYLVITMLVYQLNLYRTRIQLPPATVRITQNHSGSADDLFPILRSHPEIVDVTRLTQNMIHHQATSDVAANSTTVVTAYFNLGSFRKGSVDNIFTKKTYDNWSEVFKYILNPVIVYTDSHEFAERMSHIRKSRNETTKIIVIQRNSSWAFNLRDRISAIYSQKDYPKHYPNTVVPEYACAQIAKYDVLGRAARANTFNTHYFMWLDIGYFRDRTSTTPFRLNRPQNFNETMVAMNLILFNANLALSPEVIFKNNLLWIGGGLVFANRLTILAYEDQFRQAVEYFMSLFLMNTDQQIVYGMFSVEGRRALKPAIEIQSFKPPTEYNWFYLGYLMLHE